MLLFILQMDVTRSDTKYFYAQIPTTAPLPLSSHACCESAALLLVGAPPACTPGEGRAFFSLEKHAPGKMLFSLVITFSVSTEHTL